MPSGATGALIARAPVAPAQTPPPIRRHPTGGFFVDARGDGHRTAPKVTATCGARRCGAGSFRPRARVLRCNERPGSRATYTSALKSRLSGGFPNRHGYESMAPNVASGGQDGGGSGDTDAHPGSRAAGGCGSRRRSACGTPGPGDRYGDGWLSAHIGGRTLRHRPANAARLGSPLQSRWSGRFGRPSAAWSSGVAVRRATDGGRGLGSGWSECRNGWGGALAPQ